MVTRIVSILLFFGAALGFQASAHAQSSSNEQEAEVREFLEARDREIKGVLADQESFTGEQRERLKDLINQGIDFEAMSRTALGPFWSDLTAAQQTEYVDVFSDIVRDQSLSNLDVYRSTVSYEEITVDGSSARAVTSTVYKDVPTEVVYVLGRTDGSWKVQDIILDDVSTAEGYARSFQTVVRKRGFDALMESLRKKRESINS